MRFILKPSHYVCKYFRIINNCKLQISYIAKISPFRMSLSPVVEPYAFLLMYGVDVWHNVMTLFASIILLVSSYFKLCCTVASGCLLCERFSFFIVCSLTNKS